MKSWGFQLAVGFCLCVSAFVIPKGRADVCGKALEGFPSSYENRILVLQNRMVEQSRQAPDVHVAPTLIRGMAEALETWIDLFPNTDVSVSLFADKIFPYQLAFHLDGVFMGSKVKEAALIMPNFLRHGEGAVRQFEAFWALQEGLSTLGSGLTPDYKFSLSSLQIPFVLVKLEHEIYPLDRIPDEVIINPAIATNISSLRARLWEALVDAPRAVATYHVMVDDTGAVKLFDFEWGDPSNALHDVSRAQRYLGAQEQIVKAERYVALQKAKPWAVDALLPRIRKAEQLVQSDLILAITSEVFFRWDSGQMGVEKMSAETFPDFRTKLDELSWDTEIPPLPSPFYVRDLNLATVNEFLDAYVFDINGRPSASAREKLRQSVSLLSALYAELQTLFREGTKLKHYRKGAISAVDLYHVERRDEEYRNRKIYGHIPDSFADSETLTERQMRYLLHMVLREEASSERIPRGVKSAVREVELFHIHTKIDYPVNFKGLVWKLFKMQWGAEAELPTCLLK